MRPLVFSESTWAGSGAFGAAVITDLARTWDNLKTTISMQMSMSMYGLQNTVVDACGTYGPGPLDEELCARWMQTSAFLPLFRNYYSKTYFDAET